jgi:prepilin-type N-terminal cleavage/methylation domain-containing protein
VVLAADPHGPSSDCDLEEALAIMTVHLCNFDCHPLIGLTGNNSDVMELGVRLKIDQVRYIRTKVRQAFTLVELLIVISIISLLLQLTLPSVLMSREAARSVTCQNNLRQLSNAFLHHHDTHQHFPSGGWGFSWAPDPDGGVGENQPGGWAYSLLPYYEQIALHHLGAGKTWEQKFVANKQRLETPLAVHYCPSRRSPNAYRVHRVVEHVVQPKGCAPLEIGARIDYSVNGGGHGYRYWKPGPSSVEEAATYEFFDPAQGFGIVYPRSRVRIADIEDGTTATYLIGEKYLSVLKYEDGTSLGDDQGPYVSDDRDSVRYAGAGSTLQPLQDTDEDNTVSFGSPHPSGFFMAFCDGSVHRITYDIERPVHVNQANINDGKLVSER